jgi:hypothetical protein
MQVDLSPDEALVLFDVLSRWEQSERFDVADQAEERVLWNIKAGLERQLAEPLSPDYARLLDEARARVRDVETAAAPRMRTPAK